jgi:hypothetical protein
VNHVEVHHELCFGCGRTNLFGLLMEAQRAPDGSLSGRWFVKQDHQGPNRGKAHPGIVACALVEAVLLAAGDGFEHRQMSVELEPGAGLAVGSFCDVDAGVSTDGATATAWATASIDGHQVGHLSGILEGAEQHA